MKVPRIRSHLLCTSILGNLERKAWVWVERFYSGGLVKILGVPHLGALVCPAILDDSRLAAEGRDPEEDGCCS